jgi:hypothetical protein
MLVLSLLENTTTVAGSTYTVQFDLENPPMEQSSPAVSIGATKIAPIRIGTCASASEPMEVLHPKVTVAKIEQSSTSPGSMNTMTVTLQFNTPVSANPGATVMIHGFNGAIAEDGPMAIFDMEGHSPSSTSVFMSAPNGVPGTGKWDSSDQSLTLHIGAPLQADSAYIFKFRVRNPTCSQKAKPIELTTKGLQFQPVGCGMHDDCTVFTPTTIPACMEVSCGSGTDVEKCPMTVLAASFTALAVSECTEVCGVDNRLTISLEANVQMGEGSSFTVGNLCDVNIKSISGVVAISGRDAAMFSGQAMLDSSGCQLTVKFGQGAFVEAFERVEFCFTAVNPEDNCNAEEKPPGIQLSAWGKTAEFTLSPTMISGLVLSGGEKPGLLVAEISESTDVQRSMNTLMMRIRSNIDIPAGSNLTISGLQDTSASEGAMITGNTISRLGDRSKDFNAAVLMGMSSHFFKNEFEISTSGSLVLTVTSMISARTTKMIALEIQNGKTSQVQQTKMISVTSPKTEAIPDSLCPPGSSIVPLIAQTEFKGAALGYDTKPEFTVKEVGQMVCYPREENEISVTLQSNFQFRARTGEKLVCTISGLQGLDEEQGPKPTALFGAGPFSSACWNCECENALSCDTPTYEGLPANSLTFQVAGNMDAGCPYTFSFGVKNRKSKQHVAPVITVECKWNGEEYVLADVLNSDTSSAPSHTYGSVGDAAALNMPAGIQGKENLAEQPLSMRQEQNLRLVEARRPRTQR